MESGHQRISPIPQRHASTAFVNIKTLLSLAALTVESYAAQLTVKHFPSSQIQQQVQTLLRGEIMENFLSAATAQFNYLKVNMVSLGLHPQINLKPIRISTPHVTFYN